MSLDSEGAPPESQVTPGGVQRVLLRLAPPTPALRSFAVAQLVTSIGTGLYTTGAIVFFVRSLHFSAEFVGAGLTVAAAVGLLASLPAGRLADWRNAKQVLVALFGVQGLLFALFPLVHGRAEFIAIIVGVSLTQSAVTPVRKVVVSDLVGGMGAARVAVSAYNRSVLNVGISIGALLAVEALALDSRPAFNAMLLGNAVSFLVAGYLIWRIQIPPKPAPVADVPADLDPHAGRHPLLQPRFVAGAAICGVLYLSASILDVALPLQVSQHTRSPLWVISFLLLLNTVLVVLLQVRASRGSHTIPGAARANRLAGIVLLCSCIAFLLASHRSAAVAVAVLIVATIFLTAGEIFSSAGSWGLSYALARPDQQGRDLASFGLLSQGVQVAGPILAAAVVSAGAPAWLALGLFFLVAGLAAPFVSGRDRSVPA